VTTPPGQAGVVFVLPTTTHGQLGPVAGWISTSGWAAAARRVVGQAWIVTPQGVLDVETVRERAAHGTTSGGVGAAGNGESAGTAESVGATGTTGARPAAARFSARRSLLRATPLTVKTAIKDTREWSRARGFHIPADGPWCSADTQVEFVWQRHELFHTSGLELARALDVPSVLFVPAVHIWQARQWGVKRPGWGAQLERRGEGPALRGATLVACGTDLVAEQVVRLGVDPDRVLITPTGVDLDRFTPPPDGREVRERLGLEGKVVIGWIGSFRGFHALDQLVAAAPTTPGTVLLLVGDGPERARIERLAADAGVETVFTGTVSPADLPRHLAAMDVGVVMADPRSFHYSPLKLAEYLAAGLPVVAPEVEPLRERLDPGGNAVLYRSGDPADLRRALEDLTADEAFRQRLRAGALAAAPQWSWDEQVRRVRTAIASVRR
jgi:glycosyltransferase involved in cell wall biosynthesis